MFVRAAGLICCCCCCCYVIKQKHAPCTINTNTQTMHESPYLYESRKPISVYGSLYYTFYDFYIQATTHCSCSYNIQCLNGCTALFDILCGFDFRTLSLSIWSLLCVIHSKYICFGNMHWRNPLIKCFVCQNHHSAEAVKKNCVFGW